MQQNPSVKQHWFIIHVNLDFQKTFENLEKYHEDGTISSLEINRKGSMILHFANWDPSKVMISPKGSITCYYYENTIDPNKILPLLPEGYGYVYPEFSAVEAISTELSKYLVPVNGKNLELKITRTSLPRDYFYQLHDCRYGPIRSERFTNVRHVCSCGREYKTETWYKKHTAGCEIYDSKRSGIKAKVVLDKPGERWYVGQSPFGFVKFREYVTWEMLKDRWQHSPTIPIYLGHPKKSKW